MPTTEDLAAAVGLERSTTPTDSLRIAPRQYTVERGAVGRIEAFVRDRGVADAVIIAGERGVAAVQDDLEAALERAGVDYGYRAFDGECSVAAVASHRRALDDQVDLLVGVGGGKALDTAKLTAEGRCPVVTIPTSAATSAAWAALSVVYDEDGRYRGGVPLAGCPDALLLDPTLVADAPARYLANGVMDASAKFFETSLIDADAVGPLGALGHSVAREVYAEPLRDYAAAAVADARDGAVTPALEATSEAAVAGPGVAAGLLSDRSYLTMPHVFCYTLLDYGTVQADSYHGERVAYGVLVSQAVLGRSSRDLRALKRWYESLGQPMTLRNLGVEMAADTAERLGRDVAATLEYNLLPRSVTASDVTDAVERIEEITTTVES